MQSDRPSLVRANPRPGKRADAVAQVYAEAVQRFQAGRLSEAEALCRKVLLANPQHADNLVLLAAINTQAGRPELALELAGQVLQGLPNHAAARFNLGLAFSALKRDEEAAAAFHQVTSLIPDFFPARFNLANVLRRLGRPAEAEAAYREAIALEAGFAPAHFNHGNALQALDRSEEAAEAYRRAIALKPDYEDALTNLGGVLQDLGRPQEAADVYQRACELNPQSARIHYNLGSAFHDLSRHEDAVAAYRRAVALRPDYAEAYNNLGAELWELDHYDEAVAAYEQAVTLRSDYAEAYVNLAGARQALGQLPLAQASVAEALRADPSSARAWFIHSDLKTFAQDDPDIRRMDALLAQTPATRLDDRLHLEFALGKAWMDAGAPERAFTHLESANRLKRATLAYDLDGEIAGLAEIGRAFSPDEMARLDGAGDQSNLPIFVVGMPRSGTSLIEQILASHPKVHGAGELMTFEERLRQAVGRPDAVAALPQWIASAPKEAIAALGAGYLEAVQSLADGAPHLVDKMPGNFQFAGLIALALPNARIIHCRRDPVDTCLSCYSKKFTHGQEFSYDLQELGRYYRAYDALMSRWREVLPPNRFLEVQYEDVVADLEGEIRRLVAFCGLEWDAACLDFHTTRRPVRTASANQVRQPIYRSSVGRWRAYASQLTPLLEALGPLAQGAEASR